MEDENDTKKSSLKGLFKDGLAKGFKRLPFGYKAMIIGGVAGILFFIIIITAMISLIPFNFLGYSDSVSKNSDVKKEYEEYWDTLCNEEYEGCSDEQVNAAKELIESQSAFYDKLTKLSNKYLSSDARLKQQQKYTVLTTLFFGYDINEFTMANGAFFVDDNDEINEDVKEGQTIYEREVDSIKELVKQFSGVEPYCQFQTRLENGELSEPIQEIMKNSEGKSFSFNFFEKTRIKMGSYTTNQEFNAARDECLSKSATGSNASIIFQDTKNSQGSIDNYYRYLSESDYLDDKSVLSSYFSEYGKIHNLSDNLDEWVEEDRVAVRMQIIEEIKAIVDGYMEENGVQMETISSGTSYWWPIGSLETTTQNGVLFAAGEPQYTTINSPFKWRILNGKLESHSGIDLRGDTNSTNIIASLGGTVIKVVNSCPHHEYSDTNDSCGGSFGNNVQILDIKGNVHIYGHMYPNSILVNVGDTVMQGQVLGKVGNSGRSTGRHLHFTIKVNGQPVDPLEYISAENPRPTGGSTVNFNETAYTEEEFVTLMENYYKEESSCSNFSKESVKNGCFKLRDEILNDHIARTIYQVGVSKNINPEIYIARAYNEGFSPAVGHNYVAIGCTNSGKTPLCTDGYSSFADAAESFFNFAKRYSTFEEMMGNYAYLGPYWYNPGGSGKGGCYYANYIYPDGLPERVANACSPDKTCTDENTADCVPTNQEDHDGYKAYQVRSMASIINKIFG